MTRINTNVSSLVAQNTLGRSNASLNQALTRLSTGLRINTGKDDPAGLIASENLRSDITSIKRAITNTDRANQVIATADSALGQVSSLLNDIRGLVTESANSGALSDEQITANQLQVDSSLEALNRIAQTTTFQGRRLLDGSLNFITSAGANFGELSNLQIDQANLGATGTVSVDIAVTAAATKASVSVANIAPAVAGATSAGSLTFADGNVAASGTINLPVETSAAAAGTGNVAFTVESAASTQSVSSVTLGGTNTDTLTITAINNGSAEGATAYTIVVTDSNATPGGATASYNEGTDVLTILADITGGVQSNEIADAIAAAEDTNGDLVFTANSSGTDALIAGDEATIEGITVGNVTAGVNATTQVRTIAITTNAAADQDFNLEILLDTTANITPNDADSGDGILASIAGNAAIGYTITIANDATVDLDNLATFIQNNIDEVATATINGTASNDFNAATQALAVAPAAPIAVTGSQAQVTNNQAITVNALQSAGGLGNFAISFVTGNVVDQGAVSLDDRVVVTGNAEDGYVVTIDDTEPVTFGDISDALETIAEVGAGGSSTATAGTVFNTTLFNPSVGNTTLTGGRTAGSDVLTITADSQSADFDGTISFNTGNATLGAITVTETDGDITISVDSTSTYTLAAIRDAINTQLEGYTAALPLTNTGSGTFDGNDVNNNTAPVTANLAGGLAPSGGLAADEVIELTGSLGSQVLTLKAGTSLATVVQQINLESDATGVQATANGTTLQIQSTGYGTSALVDLKVNVGGGTFGTALGSGSRQTGTDVVATVNGIVATGDGNQLSINTATLDLSTSVAAGFTGTSSFSITGGGALFQLGPDVVSNQQARLGITSVNTAALGGVSGKLYQLGNGGTASLSSGNLDTAAAIVDEAINQVTSLRGRLGAFQRTTLETNKQALNDTLVNLSEAESSIRDADFAQETAALTRAQILVQSGTTVLQIANSNPQNVLALLRG
jgi:flagellin